MTDNYAKIVQNNLNQLYGNLSNDIAQNLPGTPEGEQFIFLLSQNSVGFALLQVPGE